MRWSRSAGRQSGIPGCDSAGKAPGTRLPFRAGRQSEDANRWPASRPHSILHADVKKIRLMQRKISGSQSWLPPDFQPAFDAYEGSRMTRKSRLKGGCRQECLPHMAASSMTDRKSTRLNSSHANISYAVFCLNKKKQQDHGVLPRAIPAQARALAAGRAAL